MRLMKKQKRRAPSGKGRKKRNRCGLSSRFASICSCIVQEHVIWSKRGCIMHLSILHTLHACGSSNAAVLHASRQVLLCNLLLLLLLVVQPGALLKAGRVS